MRKNTLVVVSKMTELTNYSDELRSADTSNEKVFQELLNSGMKLMMMNDEDIAYQFGVSRPTVTRWRNGKNAPHPAMRKVIFNWLRKRAEKFALAPAGR